MIAFVVGTTAELIKIAPVFRLCVDEGASPALWFTGQHVTDIEVLMDRLGLPRPHRWLARGTERGDLERPIDVPSWATAVLRSVLRDRRAMRTELSSDGRLPLIVVHGDTFTTVVGALLGRFLRARVAHLEAGLRSGSLASPFPEELNRRLVGRLADVHFPPTPREVDNLRRHRGAVVLTRANTVLDSLRMLQAGGSGRSRPYAVATLHRFELMQDEAALTSILEVLHEAARARPVHLFAAAPERARFERYGLTGLFDDRLVLEEKLTYLDFLPVLAGAEVVVTDSGGLQEECAYLGLPCVVHRARTERHQGLGENVVLSGMDVDVVRRVLAEPGGLRRGRPSQDVHPSAVVVGALTSMGHL